MNLRQFKEKILRTKKIGSFAVFLCPDSMFIAEQYIAYICKNSGLTYNRIEMLAETTDSALSLVFDFNANLNVLKTDTFAEFYDDYSIFDSCVVLCNKIDNKLKEKVKDFIVTFDKPETWQIEEYIKIKCPLLDKQDSDWLISAAKENLYRIDSELDKINLFSKEKQKQIFDFIRFDKETDLVLFDTYTLANAIIELDRQKIADYFLHQKYVSEEPVTLIIGLLKSFRKIMLVKYAGMTYEEIGISPGQYTYIKRYNRLSKQFLESAISFLSDMDIKVRTGKLQADNESLLTYIILKLFSFKN